MKRCPPGIICIESVTSLFFTVIVVVIIGCFIYVSYTKNQGQQENQGRGQQLFGQQLEPNYPYNNLYSNSYNLYNGVRTNMMDNTPINGVLTNPYDAPYKDERYLVPKQGQAIPINVSTNIGAVDTSYRQIGIITPLKVA